MATALLVEPKKERKKQLADLLKKEGLQVETFETTEEAVEKAKKSDARLIYLDVSTPTRSGLVALEQLKKLDLPVVVLAVSETTALKHDLYALGDVVSPPIPDKALMARVRARLHMRGRKDGRRDFAMPRRRAVGAHVVPEIHEPKTGRLDAGRMATFLGTPLSKFAKLSDVSVAALHKSPASASVQDRLLPIARAISILTQLLGSKEHVMAWLNSPHPDLSGEPPVRLILEGKAQVVTDLLEAALAGQPA